MAIIRYGTSIIHTRTEHVVALVIDGVEQPVVRVPAPEDISDEALEALICLAHGISQEVADAPADPE